MTQRENLSLALPSERVILIEPSSLSLGVPEKVEFEKESQEGSADEVIFWPVKVDGKMDQEYGCPTRAMSGSCSLMGKRTSARAIVAEKENIKERRGIEYMENGVESVARSESS